MADELLDLLTDTERHSANLPVMRPEGGWATAEDADRRQIRPVIGSLANMVLLRYEEARESKEEEIQHRIVDAARVRAGDEPRVVGRHVQQGPPDERSAARHGAAPPASASTSSGA